jgi:hypothetical protein
MQFKALCGNMEERDVNRDRAYHVVYCESVTTMQTLPNNFKPKKCAGVSGA